MTMLSTIVADIVGLATKGQTLGGIAAQINTQLATAGTSLPDLGAAAKAVIQDMATNPAPTLAKIATDGLEMAFPEFAAFIAIGAVLMQASTPADWNSPEWRLRFPNPNDPGFVMGQDG